MSPQLQTVLNHLQNFGSLSTVEAGTVYKIRSLPTRITELKKLGHNITVEIKKDATGQRYARYTLEESIGVGSVVIVVKAILPIDYSLGDIGVVTEVVKDAPKGFRVQFKHEGAEDEPVFMLTEEVKLAKTQEPVDAPILAFNVTQGLTLNQRIQNFIKGFKVHAV